MTRKTYEYAARHVQLYQREEDRATIVNALVQIFAFDNPRFDNARFRLACVPGADVQARRRDPYASRSGEE